MLKSLLCLLLALFFATNSFSQSRSLDDYLLQGSNNSPLLKDYQNQLQSASIDSLLILCAFKPQVNLTSQAMIAPYGQNIGYDEAITNGGNYSAVIGLKQSLFNQPIRSAQLENVKALKQSLGLNIKISQNEVKKSITLQYIAAYADFDQMRFSQKMIALFAEQQIAIKFLVEAGIYLQTDLMNLSVAKKAMEITCKQVLIQYKNDLALLNLLSGITDTTSIELEKPALELMHPFDMLNSSAFLQSEIDSLNNSYAKKIVGLTYRPKLEAFADAGFMSIRPVNVPRNFGASMGLNLSLPIYDGKQRILDNTKIAIKERSRLLYRDFYSRQYTQQYHQAYEQLRLTRDLILDINMQLVQQKELIDLYKIEMEKGLVRFFDFLTVINNYTTTRNNLTMIELNRLQLINQLNYLK
jgi:outer membrane protein TolC